MKYIWLMTGFFSLGLGVAGVFLPVLPTTPLVLLSAWCFSKSSDRYYQWLLNHRWFGDIIRRWEEEKRITAEVRNRAIPILWITLAFSMYFAPFYPLKLFLAVVGVVGTGMLIWLSRD